MSRAEASGDMVIIRGKINARYDIQAETEVISWFRQLLNLNIEPGMYNLEKALKSGVELIRLARVIQQGTPYCPPAAATMVLKPNMQQMPFKQMENIETFVNFCEGYGVPRTSVFQTVDLFEGRNLAQVLSCIQQLGSECQRNGFNGPTIGPRPVERNVRGFTVEQLRQGHTIIGLQAGTNKFASQTGMVIGGVRHVSDIKVDSISKDGEGIIGLQAGTNKFATQSGMTMGGVRHVADIRADDISKEGHGVIGLQAGTNRFASQSNSGIVMGGVRHAADIRADDASKDSHGVIGLQAGTNRFARKEERRVGKVC
jgi:hypothetical protein